MKKLYLFSILIICFNFSCSNDDGRTFDESANCNYETPPSLLAFYPFSANATDESTFGNHGEVEGPVLINDRNNTPESAYYFNGSNNRIIMDYEEQLSLSNEFTISAWIYPEEIKTQEIVRKGVGVNSNISFWPYSLSLSGTNDIIFSVFSEGELTQVRRPGYNINQWYLITGVLKNQQMLLYVNDELVETGTISGEVDNDMSPLLIGTRLGLPADTFKGVIDDVRIYDTALCQEDIAELFSN